MKSFPERAETSGLAMPSCRGNECRHLRPGRIKVPLFIALLACLGFLSIWWLRDDQTNAPAPVIGSGQLENVVLSESRQKTIWDAEHVTFEIESKLGKRFLTAWVERNEKQLSEMLGPEFAADTTKAAVQTRVHHNVSESSASYSKSNPQADFLHRIIDPLGEFETGVTDVPRFNTRALVECSLESSSDSGACG